MLHFLTQHWGAKVGNFLTLEVNRTSEIALFLFTDKRTNYLILISFSNFSRFLFKKVYFSLTNMPRFSLWRSRRSNTRILLSSLLKFPLFLVVISIRQEVGRRRSFSSEGCIIFPIVRRF